MILRLVIFSIGIQFIVYILYNDCLASELQEECIKDEAVRTDTSFPYWDKAGKRVTPENFLNELRAKAEGDEEKAKDGKQKSKAKPQAQGLRGWVESAGDWCSERLISARLAHPRAYRVGYFSCIGALVLFHFEIFTGGYVCRKLFAKTNGTAAAALASPRSRTAESSTEPCGSWPSDSRRCRRCRKRRRACLS